MTWEEAVDNYIKAYLACIKATNEAKKQAAIAEAMAGCYREPFLVASALTEATNLLPLITPKYGRK